MENYSVRSKFLFLDVDGVLNSQDYIVKHRTERYPIDPKKVYLVNDIQRRTGCKIIITSLWRYSEKALDALWKKNVIYDGITPYGSMSGFRGQEIIYYCNRVSNQIDKIAILDDDSDFYEDQKKNLFKTSSEEGLTKEIAEKVIAYLGEIK